MIEGCKPAKALSLSLITKTLRAKIQSSIYVVGVVILKNLTWNEHIESLIAKVNQRIGLLNRIKHLLRLDARVALYNALWAGPLEKLWGGRGEFSSRRNLFSLSNSLYELFFMPKHEYFFGLIGVHEFFFI